MEFSAAGGQNPGAALQGLFTHPRHPGAFVCVCIHRAPAPNLLCSVPKCKAFRRLCVASSAADVTQWQLPLEALGY